MLNEDELRAELDRLQPFEGRVAWMYQDSATPPNVTTGVGCLLHDVDAACALRWHHLEDGLQASRDEIAQDFFRVKAMPGGLMAAAYKGPLRLADVDIDALGFQRLRSFLGALPHVFPGYEGFPPPAQAALLDLAWNVGLGAPAREGHQATGLHGWHHLLTACNSVPPDWAAAARECRTANPKNLPSREKRNDWRSASFVDAAVAAPENG